MVKSISVFTQVKTACDDLSPTLEAESDAGLGAQRDEAARADGFVVGRLDVAAAEERREQYVQVFDGDVAGRAAACARAEGDAPTPACPRRMSEAPSDV